MESTILRVNSVVPHSGYTAGKAARLGSPAMRLRPHFGVHRVPEQMRSASMLMPHQRRLVLVLALFALFPTFALGQRKAKAEAIKTSAQLFSVDAKQALESLRLLVQHSVSFTPDEASGESAEIKAALLWKGSKASEEDIQMIVRGVIRPGVTGPSTDSASADLSALETLYSKYSAAFNSLPQGAWFAKNAVARSEALTLKLTKQMSALANKLISFPDFAEPFDQESTIIANIIKALSAPDEVNRSKALDAQVAALIALKAQSQADRQEVIKELLIAAQLGAATYNVSVQFERVSLGDVLSQIQAVIGGVAQTDKSGLGALSKWNASIQNQLKDIEATPEAADLSKLHI